MILGFALILLLGLVWVLVGVVMNAIADNRQSLYAFYAVGTLLTAAAAWVFIADWRLLSHGAEPIRDMVVWLTLAAFFNVGGQSLLVASMKSGHRGISWSVVQAAMIVPFLCSILFWGESLTLLGGVGMLFTLAAVCILGLGKKGAEPNSDTSKYWLVFVIGAMLMIGFSQVCQAALSHQKGWSDPAKLRVPIYATANAVLYALCMLISRQRLNRTVFRYSVIWAALALASFVLVFKGLDILAREGASGYAFPVAQSVSMIGFALYSCLVIKEHFNRTIKAGLAISLAGLILLGVH